MPDALTENMMAADAPCACDGGDHIERTNCFFCGYLCGFSATVRDGQVIDLKPDPTRYPYDPKVLAGCRRWRMNLDVLDHPDRINYPLRRAGERGANEWERISWDEALDDIANKLSGLRERYGAQTLCSMIGGPHTSFWPLHRFLNLFGSPNNMGIGQICWNPRIWMDVITFGWTIEADVIPGLTDCLIIWGTNPAQSDNSAWWQALRSMRDGSTPIIAIDPRYTQLAGIADVWLPVRPGTDCILALGMLNVIISEGLFDAEFVHDWCHGFEELSEHVQAFSPELVAQACGLNAEDVVRVARMWGNAHAGALVSGRGIDQVGRNVAPTHRAICCLRAITGNIDKPGACLMTESSDFTTEYDLEMTAALSAEQRAACLNTPYTPLQCYEGFEYINSLTMQQGKPLPARYLTSAHPDLVLHAIETGEPYPVTALIVEATNPLLTYADTHRVFEAFQKLELIVVLEYWMTPTASMADYVLPAAGAIERPTFQQHGGVANIVYGGPAAVEPYYERRCDYDVFRELGLRLGQADAWPDETFMDAITSALKPAGMSWESYCETGIYFQPPDPFKYLKPGPDGNPVGFATTTGKIELASEALTQLGGQRLPMPQPPTTLCSEQTRALGVHLPLITGSRKQPYNASMYFNNPAFRKTSPYPVAEVSEATAKYLGIEPGSVVTLATDKGQANFVLKVAKMRDALVNADYGWWHPEWTPGAPGFGGMWESNINCLTSCSVETGEDMIGTWWYNAIDCVIFPAKEPLSFSRDNE